MRYITFLFFVFFLTFFCSKKLNSQENKTDMQKKVDNFAPFNLTANINHLTDNEKKMLLIFFEVADIMDELFWKQAFGDKSELLQKYNDKNLQSFIEINYGPWERLNDNVPFIEGYKDKPIGANFYPQDMSKEEFNQLQSDEKTSLYTVIQRNKQGKLETVPYHIAYETELKKAAELLKNTASLSTNPSLKKYLELRAKALLSSNYFESDLAWMDLNNNNLDFVVGPIENYEDALFGYKAAFEAYILLKDQEWSKKLDKFNELLPQLQKNLPVPENYKAEIPGSDSDLGVYNVLYYAGDCNAGSKTIAINLPNDEKVHIQKGTRKLQLKNAIQAKYDKILLPIAQNLIEESQRKFVTFNAFFENILFHEVAHGLGIKNTINNKGSVRQALQEQYNALEEGKADIVGLYLVTKLYEMGELNQGTLMDNYVTFLAGIFRSVRFGAASAHGKANMVRFNYFNDKGAFTRDSVTGKYSVNFDKMKEATQSLANEILVIQGDGDYLAAKKMIDEKGKVSQDLQDDLNFINNMGIPVDIRFLQGPKEIGL